MTESCGEAYRKDVPKVSPQRQSALPGSAVQPAQPNPPGPMRPRSLYTAHTAYHDDTNNFPVSPRFSTTRT